MWPTLCHLLFQAGFPLTLACQRIHAGAVELLASPEFKQRLASEGADPVGSKPAEFASFINAELKKWDDVAKAANIQKTE